MISKEKLIKLYNAVIDLEEITLKQLLAWEFTKEEIESMVENNILTIEEDVFVFLDSEKLTSLGSELFWYKKQAFENRMSIKPINNPEIERLYKIICRNIRQNRYGETLRAIKKLAEYDPQNADVLLFLFLYSFPEYDRLVKDYQRISNLSCLRFLPEEYPQMVEARKKMACFRFHDASSIIQKIKYKSGVDYRIETYRNLVYHGTIRKENVSRIITEYFQEKKMVELTTFLESQPFLDDISRMILKLLRDYYIMSETGIVTCRSSEEPENLRAAIENYRYEKALEFMHNGDRIIQKQNTLECLEYLIKANISLKKALMSSDREFNSNNFGRVRIL